MRRRVVKMRQDWKIYTTISAKSVLKVKDKWKGTMEHTLYGQRCL